MIRVDPECEPCCRTGVDIYFWPQRTVSLFPLILHPLPIINSHQTRPLHTSFT